MDSTTNGGGLRRKDTTKGPPLRILSLDGGGVRGYSMLIILQELMHRTFVEIEGRAPKRHEIPKPADHFDLIAGTGTGGLIAIMLGRLRLDIETCKDVYVRMTRRVFETDKTFAGIPYRSTLFKASKLEDAIRDCVREHTVYEDEGNDVLANATPMTPGVGKPSTAMVVARHTSTASNYSNIGLSPVNPRSSIGTARWGNPNAKLYDTRENRTKTAVTAVYKGTSTRGSNAPAALLRSYDSRKEPAPEFECAIWQAGRATAATALAFKPIQIGQSVFLDEGAGNYNPSPQILDEAVINEWPGREVGVFVSIGTGKRPGGTNSQKHLWWEDFVGHSMGDFAEAKRKLMSKIEGCEETHTYMKHKHLNDRNVDSKNYYRFNVEVGVGEFGMNEWARLSDISTSTRMYLAKQDVQAMNLDASAKMAKIHFAKRRHERHLSTSTQSSLQASPNTLQPSRYDAPLPAVPPPLDPTIIELPAEDVMPMQPRPLNVQHQSSVADMKYTVTSSEDWPQPLSPASAHSPQTYYSQRMSTEMPREPREPRASNTSIHSRSSGDHRPSSSSDYPPPLPPKTPLPYPEDGGDDSMRRWEMSPLRQSLPYPDMDGPPPPVNVSRKPAFGVSR
ncbi:hypothetical protein AAFC00_001074 [Neodothiora populina]|uniref:PNPLA domain-containing protein n=1 Tax=Neodothiora populina TaxID=2781224 RepID=A0ABR3PN12_9PEZI